MLLATPPIWPFSLAHWAQDTYLRAILNRDHEIVRPLFVVSETDEGNVRKSYVKDYLLAPAY